jgi:regulator of cell morphogenesis and NO signaling
MTNLHQTLADIVMGDARAAVVFDHLGLDYCCRGQRTLEAAAREHGVPVETVVDQLAALEPRAAGDRPPAWTSLDDLTAHIVNTHHAYVRESAPRISRWLTKLVARHGRQHPELAEVQATFERLSDEMATHMLKEENILFPFVDALARSVRDGRRQPPSPFGTVLNPIRVMEDDHQAAGAELARLRALTRGFVPPDDACTTYRMCYEELARYEADLHQHVHLENHVLFPGALALESEMG